MLLDKGGARMREREALEWMTPPSARPVVSPGTIGPPEHKEPEVRVAVNETHDGEGCECVTGEMTLHVGDEIELTHTCHDGRVDKVTARVLSIDVPAEVEHGTSAVKRSGT